ncbi:MAG: NAD-dependent epimerase/dehydratase family protein [Lachnospiraceae bacterium]|nr:NAD-dependent epimerase/dehydratase family protein [Lachnospiraceae bacterium]
MNFLDNKDYQKDLYMVAVQLPEEAFSILITGATGLIGSFMVDVLRYANRVLNREYKIYAVGRSIEKLQQRFEGWNEVDGLHFVEQDVSQPFDDNIHVDYIVSAASNADPASYAKYPVETILTNILGTKHALEYGKKHNCKKVLLTSTMEVYGNDIPKTSFSEDDYGKIDFNQVRAGYPESKRTSELLCRSYVQEYAVPAVIARLGYIYGPTMIKTDNKVVAQFIRNILNNEDIILKSEGLQERSYLYVADTVSGIFTILFNGQDGEAYNVVSSNSVVSIKNLALLAADLAGKEVKIDLPISDKGAVMMKVQNNILEDKKLKALGWSDQYSLSDGLIQTVKILKKV